MTEEVTIPLRATGYRFSPGHRIRLTVLTGYWPALWPSPLPGALRPPRTGRALPAHPPGPPGRDRHPRPTRVQADPAAPARGGSSEDEPAVWRIEEDVINGTVAVTIGEGGASILEDGSRVYSSERLVLTASDVHPGRARLDSVVTYRWTGAGFDVEIGATGGIVSDEDAFDVRVDLGVRLDGEPFFARGWSERIPRRLG